MDSTTRALVRLAASLTVSEEVQGPVMDEAAAVAPRKAEEVLLQTHLFLGFPPALNGLQLWRRRTGRPAPEPEPVPEEGFAARGERICRQVYGEKYEALREVLGGIHPELDMWALVDGYGKVLGRPSLDLKTRELCIGAQLAGVDASRQLHAHLRGCLNVGATVDEVEAALAAVADLIGPERARAAERTWERVRRRWETREED